MLSREIELQDEIVQLLHDKDLKATVASMKADAKARFSDVVNSVEHRESGEKAKHLLSFESVVLS